MHFLNNLSLFLCFKLAIYMCIFLYILLSFMQAHTYIHILTHTFQNHTRTYTPNLQSSSAHAHAFPTLCLTHTRTHASTRTIIGLSVACHDQPCLPDLRLLISHAEVPVSAKHFHQGEGTRHAPRPGISECQG